VFLSDRNGAKFFGHGGADEGFQANAVVSLDGGYGVIVMANSDNGFAIFDEIERAVFAEYGWPGADRPLVRVALEPTQRARFVGQFVDGPAPFAIVEEGSQLVLRAPFDTPIELVPIALDRVVERSTGRQLQLGPSGDLEASRPARPSRKIPRLAEPLRHHLFLLEAGRFDDAVAAWRDRIKTAPSAVPDDERHANNLGYRVLERDVAKGTEVLRLIAIVFPDSSNAHDSLGEAYMKAGDKPRAIAEYEQALRLLDADPRLSPSVRAVGRQNAEAQLAKLRAP
jgi:hypothetical protein